MGYRIKEVREARRMSQSELAEKAGVSRGIIWALETDPDAVTTTKTLLKIAKALETSVDEIFFAIDVQ